MMRFLFLGVFALGGCATVSSTNYATPFCEQLSVFADSVPSHESRTVRLMRGGDWPVDFYKACRREDEPASIAFCDWLVEHTSTEFMEANINVALSCLQGHRIAGHIGNTGIESWSGKATFLNPNIASENVEVTVEYSVDYSVNDHEDYLDITVVAD
ncbi:MAG: hypothetical protein R3C58_07950 [Parvularculaceae bacterium]